MDQLKNGHEIVLVVVHVSDTYKELVREDEAMHLAKTVPEIGSVVKNKVNFTASDSASDEIEVIEAEIPITTVS